MQHLHELCAEQFVISDTDARMIDAARTLVLKTIMSRKAKSGQLNSMVRLLGALDRLPNLSVAENISVTILTRLRTAASKPVYQYWEISQAGHSFRIASGHMRAPQDGEAFTMLTWEFAPGKASTLTVTRNDGQLPPSARHFTGAVAAIDLFQGDYEIQVDDEFEEANGLYAVEPVARARNVLPLHP